MTKASDNAFPSILIAEGTEPSAPAAGHQRVYIDSTTHKLKRTDSSGTDVTVEGGLADQGVVTYLDFTTAAAPASPAAGKIRVYSKTGDHLAQKDSGGAETLLDAAGGGGSFTQSYMGYNTVGGSVESVTSSRWYAKKITTTGACELLSVEAYLTQITNVNAHLMAAAVWDHNSTKPGLLLSAAFIGAGTAAAIAINKNSAPGTARWFGLAMGLHLAASTDYWIGFMVTLNSGAVNLAYDGSGTDRYMTASGMYATDWDYFTDNSTTNKYSIRANTIA